MQLSEILSELENNNGRFPRLALEKAIENREAMTPLLLATLEKYKNNLEELLDKPDSSIKALAHYQKMIENSPNIHKSIGTQLAKGFIHENDGVVTEIDYKGHFDLHPYENNELSTKFEIISVLYHQK